MSEQTRRRLVEASGELASTGIEEMAGRLPWFRRLSAEQRADVHLVTQAGVRNFAAWLGDEGETVRLTAEAFRNAPRDLARRVSLRQTVELVRVAIEVLERRLPLLAGDDAERRLLVEAILRFGREVAFSAAIVYAGAAESRGAWDARLEALVVDGVVRGEVDDALVSRASALGWDAQRPVTVLVGSPPPDETPGGRGRPHPAPLASLRRTATRLELSVLLGVHGDRLVVLVSGALDPRGAERVAAGFGPGPVVVGPPARTLGEAHLGARDAVAGLRAVAGRLDAPRLVAADDLLPERALLGDPAARERLVGLIAPLVPARGPAGRRAGPSPAHAQLARTLATYLDGGGALESCARALFVHPNTVRYRLRRVREVTGLDPTAARPAFVLRVALILGRLDSGVEETSKPGPTTWSPPSSAGAARTVLGG